MLDGSAELGFVEGTIDEPALAHWVVAKDRLALVGDASAPQIDEDWIQAATWIVREQGSGTRSPFEDVLRHRGIDAADLRVGMTLPRTRRSARRPRPALALRCCRTVVARAIKIGNLHELPLELPERAFHALRHKERYRTRAADALDDLIKEQAK